VPRFTVTISVDSTRAKVDQITTDLRVAIAKRLPAGAFFHMTVDTENTSEQIGGESL
jgi:hypothetical protein